MPAPDPEELVLVSVCDTCDRLYPQHDVDDCEGIHVLAERPKEWVQRQRSESTDADS